MTHVPYIAAAYGAAVIVLGGMVVLVLLDLRTQKHRLAELEREGGRRRPTAS